MPRKLKLIPYEAYDDEIEKLRRLFENLGIDIPGDAPIAADAIEAFKFLYYATFAADSGEITIQRACKQAGLGDLATKINKASSKTSIAAIRPHLEKMVEGAVRVNDFTVVTDDAANKTTELYVGCLALGRNWSVTLDHPVKSSGGRNPDVVIQRNNNPFSIAVKTIHGYTSKTMFDSIAKAAKQIEASSIAGIAFVDLRNRVQNATKGVYGSIEAANATVRNEMVQIAQKLHDEIAEQDWREIFAGAFARPVVAFIAQAVTRFQNPGSKEIFVPVRHIVSATYPPVPKIDLILAELDPLDREALDLILELNCELQAAPGET
jgi:hypothetical protein